MALGIFVVVLCMIGGALLFAKFLSPQPSTCADMSNAAGTSASADARRVDVVIGMAGNGPNATAEAKQYVRDVLKAESPDAAALVKVTLVNGDQEFTPTGAAADCVGRALLVAPSQADLKSYKDASDDARPDVATALRKQYDGQVDQLASAVADAMSQAPAPSSSGANAFMVWPFVTQIPHDHEAAVLAPFTAGGDNCLTVASPSSLASDGKSTHIGERVGQCVTAGELATADPSKLKLTGVATLSMTGTQRDAQNAVIEALCRRAAKSGC